MSPLRAPPRDQPAPTHVVTRPDDARSGVPADPDRTEGRSVTIPVTGATGSVGRLVVAQLVETGVRVRALTRDPGSASFPRRRRGGTRRSHRPDDAFGTPGRTERSAITKTAPPACARRPRGR
ncbi:NmrA family NAD(P)-binding protein [Plantactinospora sp. KLBMP9567]|uniref:NmrA family NAD(P)-binding protein n=1 Tax=Plantactinospora sp. KLBMP9567 TaxID=3085900 RepID=UPI00399054EC